MKTPTKQGLRRGHHILIWDSDWEFKTAHRINAGVVFKKGIEIIQNPANNQAEYERKMAFVQGKYEEKCLENEQLKAKLANVQ